MIYYLFEFLEKSQDLAGAGLLKYISVRSAASFILALSIGLIFGKRIINKLRSLQIGESVRDLGLHGQVEKAGTPTMGGIIKIISTLVPVLLFTKLFNIYIVILVTTTLWMGCIGFLDDYIKVFKKNKDGLKGRFKVMGQIGLGIIVGAMLYFNEEVTVREKITDNIENVSKTTFGEPTKDMITTVPFFKHNQLDYSEILTFISDDLKSYGWLIFIPMVILIITAVSNGANLTDGIDGLAAGTSTIVVVTLGVFAWVSGNIIYSDYLDVMYIPNSGEIVVFISAFAGALIGFLWYNSYPAQVFMGDTGSLTIGGIIAVIAISIRKELLIPILAGVFLMENLSVILQVGYFKYTKKKSGVGKRIFLMAPLHHHFQKKGFHESKIVTRFLIVSILLAVITVVTLKIR